MRSDKVDSCVHWVRTARYWQRKNTAPRLAHFMHVLVHDFVLASSCVCRTTNRHDQRKMTEDITCKRDSDKLAVTQGPQIWPIRATNSTSVKFWYKTFSTNCSWESCQNIFSFLKETYDAISRTVLPPRAQARNVTFLLVFRFSRLAFGPHLNSMIGTKNDAWWKFTRNYTCFNLTHIFSQRHFTASEM